MKIAFYTTTVLEHGGGLEKYLIDTAEHFCRFKNIQADVITMDNNVTNRIVDILSILSLKRIDLKTIYIEKPASIKKKLGGAHYHKIDSLRNLREKFNGYDYIYSKNELLEAFIFTLIGYENIPPVIFGGHTSIYYDNPSSFKSVLHNILYNSFVYKFLARGISTFHVINSKDEISYKNLFPEKNIVKIPNPFDFSDFIKKSRTFKFKYSFNKNKYNIVWIGRLTKLKGVSDLIELINKINNTPYKDKVSWNIVGDGEEKTAIREIADKWDNVRYFGHIANEFIPSLLQSQQLFISTSHSETLGYTLIEALTMNVPVLSYNIAGPRDIIITDKNGFLVNNINSYYEELIKFINKKYKFTNLLTTVNPKFSNKLIYKSLINLFK